MRVENRETESQEKEDRRQPARDFREHICRLRAENVFRHAAAKSCAQALAFWTLHQDHEDHEKRDENVEPEQDIDQKGHRDGQYRQPARFVNGGLELLEQGVIIYSIAPLLRFPTAFSFTAFQISSSSSSPASPNFFPRPRNSSST